ncbi:fumarylacetoacetate hydrolase family protein [Glaciibacter sp. 2TAF33]|uniref:fumarylacetoacetate hydrolase family protein n=1 Tax=Glaciibacter sp. 2TAF33 TaxID=3233015 RepID=UPI003F8E5EAB
MKIVGIRLPGQARIRVARLEGTRVTVLTDVAGFWRDPRGWTASGSDAGGESFDLAEVELAPAVLPSARVICVGLNYQAHAAEGSFRDDDLPPYPTLFARWTASLSASGDPAPVPSNEDGLDWEGEVAAFIGTTLTDADSDTAREAVIGYAAFNDLTARRAQKLTSQWILGKNGDNTGPLGPLVTVDEAGDLRDGLRVQTRVNGTLVQDGNTRDMIYELGDVLSFISRTFTLNAGDVICTGTPAGVGYARTPPWLLHPGDTVEVEVERVGIVTTPIVDNDYRHGSYTAAVLASEAAPASRVAR